MRFVFGPVPSRRLGRSLGVDLIPYKTCSFDCIYCQLGRTVCKTGERKAFVDIDEVIAELESVLPQMKADYVTMSGSGEPTLSLGLGRLIRRTKELTETPVAVITNGSMVSHRDVQDELLDADLVIPSIDAASPEAFERINRPLAGLSVDAVIGGIEEFSRRFPGKLWVEVMLVKGINDSDEEIEKLSSALGCIRAEKIQLNTVERPPAESFACPLSALEMDSVRRRFGDRAEVIVSNRARWADHEQDDRQRADGCPEGAEFEAECELILALLRRRPCTVVDVADGLGMNVNEAAKLVGILKERGMVSVCHSDDGRVHFCASV